MTDPIIDCDVHHEVGHTAEVLDYMPSGWRAFVEEPGADSIWPQFNYATPHGGYRHDCIPADGGRAGSSLALMREQLLDGDGVTHPVLTFARGLYVGSLRNPWLARVVASALNHHMIERWLEEEPRLRGSVVLASQVPEFAAAEIRARADHPQVVQAVASTNGLGPAFGHPVYDVVHRTLAECGMPLAIHALGEGAAGAVTTPTASSSAASFYTEFHTGAMQGVATHLMSFILHGVFERYPGFRLVLTESGVTWLPAFLRRMDENYRGLRMETPWCKRLPSEYFHDHVLVTTQPLDIESPDDAMVAPLRQYGFEDVMVFSSDYPHWDADTPAQTIRRLPQAWRRRVLWENAAAVYGLVAPTASSTAV